jgi:serine/threonine-protein kinase PpkA
MSQGGSGGKRILIVDRDTDLCAFIRGHLQGAGFQGRVVADSGIWPDQAQDYRPDLILCDLGALSRDEFRPLRTLRTRNETSAIPLIALTAAGQEAAVIQALKLGADEFLPKPFSRDLLLNAVNSRLGAGSSPAIAGAADDAPRIAAGHKAMPADGDADMISAAREKAARPPAVQILADQDTRDAVVLLCEIVNYTRMVENLDAAERKMLLDEYYARLREPLLRRDGSVVTFMGESVLALFEAETDSRQNHAGRAATAALRISVVADRLREWLQVRFADRGLPEFAIVVALHMGEVTVCDTAASQEGVVIGPVVDSTARLCRRGRELGWSIIASDLVARSVRVASGRRDTLELGRGSMEIVEITGLLMEKNSAEMMAELVGNIRKAVAANSAVLFRMLQASMEKTGELAGTAAPVRSRDKTVEIEGFRLIQKIGEGGMSQVFLAENRAGGPILVLKVLELSHDAEDMVLRRFVQEFALASNIRHRNVARIFAQGFTEDHAYIAMEYLPQGDLRKRIAEGLDKAQALAFLIQIARALVAIHNEGIVHCDLKPDNLMLRDDSSLVLADFGIAKHSGAGISVTGAAEVLGTPYYISPEQALGNQIDARSDLYSLGVIFFEMLTGRKPYQAETVADLLDQHVQAPPPRLPVEHAECQHVLDKLMAKDPGERYVNAAEALAAIAALAQSVR